MPTSAKPVKNFNFYFYTFVLIGFAILLALIVLNLFAGPRLRNVKFDTQSAVKYPNEKLILYSNLQLSKVNKKQVSIFPEVKFDLASNGNTIVLRLKERLRYAGEYTVRVSNVSTSSHSNKTANFEYSFTTPQPQIYYLKRNKVSDNNIKQQDEILESDLTSKNDRVIYRANKIEKFVKIQNKLAISSIKEDSTSELVLFDLSTAKTEILPLPATGNLARLKASSNEKLLGYSFTSNDQGYPKKYQDVLFSIDLSFGKSSVALDGIDNRPVQVTDWAFAPDGNTVLAQMYDAGLLLIDTTGRNDPVPLGRFSTFTNFSSNGSLLAVHGDAGAETLNLITKERKSTTKGFFTDPNTFIFDIKLLQNSDGYLAHIGKYDANIGQNFQYIYLVNSDAKLREIFKMDTHPEMIRIIGFDITPNDQFATIESTNNKEYIMDNYPTLSKNIDTYTVVLDLMTGKIIKKFNGFNLVW